jgi:hypothetical protein
MMGHFAKPTEQVRDGRRAFRASDEERAMKRTTWLGVAGLVIGLPALLGAQGLGIEHDGVDCIVAGKFPRMNACFQPASALATARVYFRVEGTEDWYYVEMGPEAPCYSGYLPKPGKQLIDKKLEYYVQATGKQYAEGQTQIYTPIVVSSEDRCQKKLAPFVSRASVRVFPAMPGGFAASSFPIAVVAGGGAAAAAGVGAAVALSGDDDTTTTTQGSAPTTVAVVTTTTTTTVTTPPPTTPPPTTNSGPTARLRTNPDPIEGDSPLHVTFNMCGSTDPDGDDLTFRFTFGDGAVQEGDSCSATHTYTATAATTVRTHDSGSSESCVKDASHPYACISRPYTASLSPVDRCQGVGAPEVQLTSPDRGDYYYPSVLNFRSAVTPGTSPAGGPVAIQKVRYFAEVAPMGYKPRALSGSAFVGEGTTPPSFPFDLANPCAALEIPYYSEVTLFGLALDECGNEGESNHVRVYLECYGYYASKTPAPTASTLSWTNQLEVPGARTQVVLNGRSASYPGPGRSMALGEGRRGENRVEAHLIEATGPGLWSFQFLAGSLEPGSLQAVAGQVAEISNDAITFRLNGEPGEQVVFTFRPKR